MDDSCFLTDVDGVRGQDNQIRPAFNTDECRRSIENGVATGGMRAKLESASEALAAGMGEVVDRARRLAGDIVPSCWRETNRHPIDYRMKAVDDGLARFAARARVLDLDRSPDGSQRPRLADIPALLELINGYAAQRIMLPRTEFEMSENIRDFTVAYAGPRLLGCGALHFYTPSLGRGQIARGLPSQQANRYWTTFGRSARGRSYS